MVFAAGLERLVLLLRQVRTCTAQTDIYVVAESEAAIQKGLWLAEQLRSVLPHYVVETNLSAGSFKSQFKRADKSGAKWAIVIGDEEIKTGVFTLKSLREATAQQPLSIDELMLYFKG